MEVRTEEGILLDAPTKISGLQIIDYYEGKIELLKKTITELKDKIESMSTQKETLTSKEVCKLLGISAPTLWRLKTKGTLVALGRIGRFEIYDKRQVESLLSK